MSLSKTPNLDKKIDELKKKKEFITQNPKIHMEFYDPELRKEKIEKLDDNIMKLEIEKAKILDGSIIEVKKEQENITVIQEDRELPIEQSGEIRDMKSELLKKGKIDEKHDIKNFKDNVYYLLGYLNECRKEQKKDIFGINFNDYKDYLYHQKAFNGQVTKNSGDSFGFQVFLTLLHDKGLISFFDILKNKKRKPQFGEHTIRFCGCDEDLGIQLNEGFFEEAKKYGIKIEKTESVVSSSKIFQPFQGISMDNNILKIGKRKLDIQTHKEMGNMKNEFEKMSGKEYTNKSKFFIALRTLLAILIAGERDIDGKKIKFTIDSSVFKEEYHKLGKLLEGFPIQNIGKGHPNYITVANNLLNLCKSSLGIPRKNKGQPYVLSIKSSVKTSKR